MIRTFTFLVVVIWLISGSLHGQGLRKSDLLKEQLRTGQKKTDTNGKTASPPQEAYGDAPIASKIETFGGSGDNTGKSVVKDSEGNIYVYGEFSDEITFGDNSISVAGGLAETYIAKYDQSGNLVWVKNAITTDDQLGKITAESIAIDDNDNLYIAGVFGASGVVAGNLSEDAPSTGINLYLAKLNSEGVFDQLATDDQFDFNDLYELSVSLTYYENHIYVKGDVDLAKYDLSWNNIWFESNTAWLRDIDIFQDYIYATGHIESQTFFGATLVESFGYHNGFLFKMDLDGNYIWAHGSNTNEVNGLATSGLELVVDSSENIYAIGKYRNEMNWGGEVINDDRYEGTFMLKTSSAGDINWLKALEQTVVDDAAIYDTAVFVSGKGGNAYLYEYDTSGLNISTSASVYFEQAFDTYLTGQSIIRSGLLNSNTQLVVQDYDYNLEWEANATSNAGIQRILAVETDSMRNTYIYGYVEGENAEFNKSGAFLIKQDQEGNLVWKSLIEGAQLGDIAIGTRMVVDKVTEEVAIIGGYDGTITIGDDEFTSTSDSYFLAKYEADGSIAWAKDLDVLNAQSVNFDGADNLIVSGIFNGEVTFGSSTYISSPSGDAILVKYNKSGGVLWSKHLEGGEIEYIGMTSVDNNDEIYLAGEFHSRNIVIGSEADINLGDEEGNTLVFKFEGDGSYVWHKVYGGGPGFTSDTNWPTGIKLGMNGDIYLQGWHSDGSVYGDTVLNIEGTNTYSKYVAKLDNEGEISWIRSIQEVSGFGYMYNELDVDHEGSLYVSSDFRGKLKFEEGVEFTNVGRDVFYAKYDVDGTLIWVKALSGDNNRTTGLAVLSPDNIKVAGVYDDFMGVEDQLFEASATNAFLINLCATPEKPVIFAGNQIVCANTEASVYQLETQLIEAYTWELLPASAGSIVSAADSAVVTWDAAFSGEATITVTASNDCGEVTSDIMTVNVNARPTINEDGNVLTASTGDSYQWYLNGEAINGATNQEFTAEQSGDYSVMVVVGDCNDVSETLSLVITGDDEGFAERLSMHPNPANDRIEIDVTEQVTSLKVNIKDINGKVVLKKTFNKGATKTMDITSLKKGIYFVVIGTDNQQFTKKLIKQ